MDWTLSAVAGEVLVPSGGELAARAPAATREDFELYSFAALQCGGWFVEPNPKERDLLNLELFEVDAVVRKPFGRPGSRLLAVEAKSGTDWGAGDVLKLLGRSRYFDAEGSVFVFRKESGRGPLEQRMTPRLRELGMRTVRVLDHDAPTAEQVLGAFYQGLGLTPGHHDPVRFSSWLYSHMIQQRLRPQWGPMRREHPGSDAIEAAHRWNVKVYENLPLAACPVERLVSQEESFRRFGRLLALNVARDLDLVVSGTDRLPRAMVDRGRNRWIQAALLLQHAARLAILANLVEIVALCPEDDARALAVGRDPRLPGHWRERLASALIHPDATRWPLLWQTYLGCWGGFLVTERRDDEMEALGTEVGLPLDKVEAGLAVFEAFFPLRDGRRWHHPTDDGLEVLTLVPAALRGVGVFHRLRRQGLYGLDRSGRALVTETLEHEYGVNPRAAAHLTRWHDIGAATLLGTLE